MYREGSPIQPDQASVSEFVACAAEELRVPITAIVGYVELLSLTEVAEDSVRRDRALRALRAHARELHEVAETLSESSIATGPTAARDAVDARALVADAAAAFRQTAPGGVFADIEPGVLSVVGDSRKLRAAVDCLLRLVAWGAAGTCAIQVGLREADGNVEVTVAAPGAAVVPEAEHRPRLGEWVARRVAALHGGSLHYDHESLRATLLLPAFAR